MFIAIPSWNRKWELFPCLTTTHRCLHLQRKFAASLFVVKPMKHQNLVNSFSTNDLYVQNYKNFWCLRK